VNMPTVDVCEATQRSFVGGHRFGGTYCLYLQGGSQDRDVKRVYRIHSQWN
jgi:hypothetical protein